VTIIDGSSVPGPNDDLSLYPDPDELIVTALRRRRRYLLGGRYPSSGGLM